MRPMGRRLQRADLDWFSAGLLLPSPLAPEPAQDPERSVLRIADFFACRLQRACRLVLRGHLEWNQRERRA